MPYHSDMIDSIITPFLFALWQVFLNLSPALILGLIIAGAVHVLLPSGLIHRHLNRPGLGSISRGAVVGVPMTLCSCGVVPAALGLKKDGASNGATTSFLISTPQVGADSIMVSASLLGWPFALFKVVAAFVTGILGGWLAEKVAPTEPTEAPIQSPHETRFKRPVWLESLHYSFHDLFGAIDQWLLVGVVMAAVITAAAPPDFFAELGWTQGLTGMLLMLAIATPLYVCTTASVPLAASFIAAGMPTGTAMVFLMAGPATNIATMGAIYRVLGGRLLAAYLGTVLVMSIGFGLTFDFLIDSPAPVALPHEHGTDWIATISAVAVILGMLWLNGQRVLRKFFPRTINEEDMDLTLKVDGMTCPHCVANVKRTLESQTGVDSAEPDLDSGTVAVQGDGFDVAALRASIEQAGYKVVDE